jgi:hypothetical protein
LALASVSNASVSLSVDSTDDHVTVNAHIFFVSYAPLATAQNVLVPACRR